MRKCKQLGEILELLLPWLVLAAVLLYTYAKFFLHPYDGFRWDADGRVATIHVIPDQPSLQVGDQLVKIGGVAWQDFQADLRLTLYKNVQPGQIVPLEIERAGQQMTIQWEFPGPNHNEVLDLVVNEGWLAFLFWLTGTLTLLHLRPKDERWALLAAFNYLTAIWLATGSGVSFDHTWNSAIFMRMGIWLCVPVYLHLHWVYPQPFRKIPAPVVWASYLLAAGLAIAQWFQLLDRELYLLGFLLAISGSLLLLIAHLVLQKESRRDLRLLLISAFLSLFPAILVGIYGAFSTVPLFAGAGTIGLPFLPLTYFYAAYRRQLGKLELRVNQLVSIYIYFILLVLLALPLIVLGYTRITSPSVSLSLAFIGAVLSALLSLWIFPFFQSFVEHRLLGIRVPPKNLQEIYAARITASASLPSLLQLLEEEVLPSLLVRQFAFLRIENSSLQTLLALGIPEEVMGAYDLPALALLADENCLPESRDQETYGWIRLAIPLKVGPDVLGFWLFGRRDPDDIYSQREVPVLQSLAHQTAVALSNMLQTDRLRAMYQADINRHEEERIRLALDLHDSILNQLAVLQMNLDQPPSPRFQEAYDGLTQRLREIVSDLRPPMLNYGLEPAIKELAENLMERSQDTIQVNVDLQSSHDRYPPTIEIHLLRIIQEACGNAVRHAQAGNITISGQLDAKAITLALADDGIGFETGEALELDTLLANKQFGLAGMIERAALIGAVVRITSRPGHGTQIRIGWKAPGLM
ncbi:MAG: ATP-binding protein [Chloroflexota bacterium]